MNFKSEHDIKFFEQELKKLKFKKAVFSDGSGYWYECHRKFMDFKLLFTVEPDRSIFTMGCMTGDWQGGIIKFHDYYEDVANYKCDLKTIKKVINKYK